MNFLKNRTNRVSICNPGPYELARDPNPIRQIIRPTGLLDPIIEVRKAEGQIDDILKEVRTRVEKMNVCLLQHLLKNGRGSK